MKVICKKLNNRRGASLLLALLVFLICSMAGMGALTAASANAGRYQYAEKEEQAYLAVTSAARLVGETLKKSTYDVEYIETKVIEKKLDSNGQVDEKEVGNSLFKSNLSEKNLSQTDISNLLEAQIDKLFEDEYKIGTDYISVPPSKLVIFTFQGMPDVHASLEFKEEGSNAAQLTGTFWVQDKNDENRKLYETQLIVNSTEWKRQNPGAQSEDRFISRDGDIETYERKTKFVYQLQWTKATYSRPGKGETP